MVGTALEDRTLHENENRVSETGMRVAAYQAPLAKTSPEAALASVREQIDRCESLGVAVLCCPEGMLGGLADYQRDPAGTAVDVESGGDMVVVRADVAGITPELVSYGASAIVDRDGTVMETANRFESTLLVADISVTPRASSVRRPPLIG